jgi:hypothetical protein
MHTLSISIVSLGSLKYPIDMSYLEKWNSQLVKIQHGESIRHLPNAKGPNWEYTSKQLGELIQADDNASFTLGLISAGLEGNYYMRRLGNKVAVLSIFEMAEIVRYSDFSVENFILRNIYELAVLYTANGTLVPSGNHSWTHDDVRGCLFDMNANKTDIVFSMHQPILCNACRERVLSKQVNSCFLPALDGELLRIKKPMYFRITEWVKSHPLYALTITAFSTVILNLVASIIFEKFE